MDETVLTNAHKSGVPIIYVSIYDSLMLRPNCAHAHSRKDIHCSRSSPTS